MVAGKKRYFNSCDDMYLLYCDYVGTLVSRDVFGQYYNQYIENVMDRSTMEDMIEDACVNDVVVLFVKDHFRISTSNSWISSIPELSIYFSNLFEYYPNKRFILVTSLENLDKEIINPNCTIIPMGGDVTNQLSLYMQHVPSVEKNIDAMNFISLNRGSRHHRTYLVSALYGRELDTCGHISHLSWPIATELAEVINYDHTADINYELTNSGFKRFVPSADSSNIYDAPNDNLTNFKQSLQHKYNDSIVEFYIRNKLQ
jgi:hypothetical protein